MIRGCLKSLELVEFYAKRPIVTWLILAPTAENENFFPRLFTKKKYQHKWRAKNV
jgi:hypothetical protein